MRNVPVIGLLQEPSVKTKSSVKQRPYSTPKQGYTGRQSIYGNIDGTITTSLKDHQEWEHDKPNQAGE